MTITERVITYILLTLSMYGVIVTLIQGYVLIRGFISLFGGS